MTQMEIAEGLGIGQAQVSRILSGHFRRLTPAIRSIAELSGVDIYATSRPRSSLALDLVRALEDRLIRAETSAEETLAAEAALNAWTVARSRDLKKTSVRQRPPRVEKSSQHADKH